MRPFAWLLVIASLGSMAFGLATMYAYARIDSAWPTSASLAAIAAEQSIGHVLPGIGPSVDAANLVIIGIRGLAWILVGVGLMVAAGWARR